MMPRSGMPRSGLAWNVEAVWGGGETEFSALLLRFVLWAAREDSEARSE